MSFSVSNQSFSAPQPSCEVLDGTADTLVTAPRTDGSEGCVGLSQTVVDVTQAEAAPQPIYQKTVGVPVQHPEALAYTGSETTGLTALGLGAIAIGSILVRWSKQSSKHFTRI